MLDVASLGTFDFFKSFQLAAGHAGLHRTISNVVILDYEGIDGDFSGFHEGDFVITNMMFAKNHPERIFPAFKALIDIGVSAFAVKTVFFADLPADVIKLSNQLQVPVFFFHDIYIEDVILSITDHLRSSANYSYYESIIDSFLTEPSHNAGIKELLISLLPDDEPVSSQKTVSALYLLFQNGIDEFSMQRNLNKLILQAKHMKTAADLHILKYKKGILFLCFHPETPNSAATSQDTTALWHKIIKELGLSSCIAGISDKPLLLSKIDVAIERSIEACRNAQINGQSPLSYTSLGLSCLLSCIVKDRTAHEFLSEKLEIIESSGSRHKALFDTMSVLCAHNFDIDAAALSLYQHPNTIRYRIAKLKELLSIHNDWEFEMLCMLLCHITP